MTQAGTVNAPMMSAIYCQGCGSVMSSKARACPACGHPVRGVGKSKSRVVAAVLALLLGGLGAHKFYLGKVGLGILYLLFCWLLIPAVVALIEGIVYLVQDDETFAERQGVDVS
jgi:hypothetical protein